MHQGCAGTLPRGSAGLSRPCFWPAGRCPRSVCPEPSASRLPWLRADITRACSELPAGMAAGLAVGVRAGGWARSAPPCPSAGPGAERHCEMRGGVGSLLNVAHRGLRGGWSLVATSAQGVPLTVERKGLQGVGLWCQALGGCAPSPPRPLGDLGPIPARLPAKVTLTLRYPRHLMTWGEVGGLDRQQGVSACSLEGWLYQDPVGGGCGLARAGHRKCLHRGRCRAGPASGRVGTPGEDSSAAWPA